MTEKTDLPALIAEVRRLDAEATKGPWYPGHNPESREPLDYIAECYSYGPPGKVHLTCVPFGDKPIDDEALFTAITGNGPTSERNAALIAHYRTAAPLLADECERLQAEVTRLRAERDMPCAHRLEEERLQERVRVLEAALVNISAYLPPGSGSVALQVCADMRADARAALEGIESP